MLKGGVTEKIAETMQFHSHFDDPVIITISGYDREPNSSRPPVMMSGSYQAVTKL